MITAWKWDPVFLPKNGGAMYGWFYFLWIGIALILDTVPTSYPGVVKIALRWLKPTGGR